MSHNSMVLYCGKTKEFEREARKFQEYWNVPEHLVKDFSPYRGYRRKYEALKFLSENRRIKNVAIFCHGWKNRIELGFKSEDVKLLSQIFEPMYRVILYCCSCGKKGGFAEQLARADDSGLQVFAHTTSGHTTMNPFVVNYHYAMGDGGNWFPIRKCKSIKADNPWFYQFEKMLNNYGELRFLYPFMCDEDLIDTVETGKIVKSW